MRPEENAAFAKARSLHAGFTLLEIVISLGVMSIILLAGSEIITASVKMERDMLESMESASTEVMAADRIYQDLKFAFPSFNFLMRFDDGRTPSGKSCRHTTNDENTRCYSVEDIVPQKSCVNKMADYDFYLYNPACGAGEVISDDDDSNLCYRSVTLNANNTYPDGLPSGSPAKRDFVVITTDTAVANGFGISAGTEFFAPDSAFVFVEKGRGTWPSECSKKDTVKYCNKYEGLSYNYGKGEGLKAFLQSKNIGRYLLLSSPIKQPTYITEKCGTCNLKYPDMAVNYPLRIVSRAVNGKTAVDVRPDYSLSKHLEDYTYASNYILTDEGVSTQDEIHFHDEEIFGGLGEGTCQWTHFYHGHSHPGTFLKILQAYNGTQTDYIVRPIRIIRYHLSDAYQREIEKGNANPDEKLRNKDPCLTRYVYRGNSADGTGSTSSSAGRWVGIECQFPGVEKIVFFRPNVSLPLISFKIFMQSNIERQIKRREVLQSKSDT